ncbi:hypothetical protein ACTRXD_12740 [Nitrospira sp. T9]|uniref:hypothetical protein n=1 Tax=unclassified Nitrospira TaxID=2652172 RepID=UPI003F9D86D3
MRCCPHRGRLALQPGTLRKLTLLERPLILLDIRAHYSFIVILSVVIASSGCTTTTPTGKDGTILRTSVESFYREAPWVNAKPTNIKAMGDALVNTTQGLADISAAYSTQLQINGLAQQQLLHNPPAYQSRSAEIRECINVGGGVQGGLTCEKIGLTNYREQYVNQARSGVETLSDVPSLGWTQTRGPLFTELELAEFATAVGGLVQANGRMGRALPRAFPGRR